MAQIPHPSEQPLESDLQRRPVQDLNRGCSRGCMIWAAAIGLLVAVGVIVVILNIRSIAARAVAFVVKRAVEKSDLPSDQKRGLVDRVDQLREEFSSGRISDEQLARIGREILEGPLLPVGMVMFLEQEHIAKSGLSDAEKQEAKLTLQRLSRGVIEKTIRQPALEPIFAGISGQDEQGRKQIKKKLTDTELRDFLTLAQREVEKAKVPVEPLEIDLTKELDKAIERGKKEPVEGPF